MSAAKHPSGPSNEELWSACVAAGNHGSQQFQSHAACSAQRSRQGRIANAWRALRVWWLRWHASCIADERHEYEKAGCVGPVYLRNSLNDQLQCLREARLLELGN